MRKRAHGAGEFPNRDLLPDRPKPHLVAPHLLVPDGQLESEGYRLPVNPVRTPDHDRMPVLERPLFEHSEELIQIGQDDVQSLYHLERQRGVHDI